MRRLRNFKIQKERELMGAFVDLTGHRFGRLSVVRLHSRSTKKPYAQPKWLCKCDCGNDVVVRRGNLTSGNTQSCGCLRDGVRGSYTPNANRLYNSWRAMKSRCSNPNNNRYYAYGGRGIAVCDEWKKFSAFEEWAISNGFRNDLTIDRIDPNGNYEPSNCRWISPESQAANKRKARNDQ